MKETKQTPKCLFQVGPETLFLFLKYHIPKQGSTVVIGMAQDKDCLLITVCTKPRIHWDILFISALPYQFCLTSKSILYRQNLMPTAALPWYTPQGAAPVSHSSFPPTAPVSHHLTLSDCLFSGYLSPATEWALYLSYSPL